MNPPFDADAEAAVIGCCLYSPHAARWAHEWLRSGDFYQPRWQAAHAAICALHGEGQRADPVTVAARAKLLGYATLSPAELLAAQSDAPAVSSVEHYGHIIRRHAVARQAMGLCYEAVQHFGEPTHDPDELLDALLADLRSIDSHVPSGSPEGYLSFEELRAKPPEERSPWVLHGLLRRDWRALFVGPEGAGKTLLLRQLAVAAASGMDPFRGGSRPAVRTLLVDLENPEDHLADWVDRLCRHGESLDHRTEGRGRVWHRPGGIDLRKRGDRGSFEDVLRDHRPELVCLGPLYKAFRRGSRETEEEAAGETQEVFDDLRTRYGFGLVLEHHAPKAQGGVRDLQPFGSSLWLRWGEIRMSLVPPDRKFPVWTMELRPFSGARVEHNWPQRIDRNTSRGMPWLGRWEPTDA